jgi:hypothetical protein
VACKYQSIHHLTTNQKDPQSLRENTRRGFLEANGQIEISKDKRMQVLLEKLSLI